MASLLLVGWLVAAGGCGDGPAPQPGYVGFVPDGDALEFNRVYLTGVEIGENQDSDAARMTLGIYAQAIEGLYAGGFRITYDPAMLELVSVTPANDLLSFGTSFENDSFGAGELMVGFVLDQPRDDADIGFLTFEALAEGASDVRFAEPPAGPVTGIRRLTDQRGYQRYGVRWIGGTMTRWDGGRR